MWSMLQVQKAEIPVEDIYKINEELKAYNPEIAERPQVIAANKTDLIYDPDEDPAARLRQGV